MSQLSQPSASLSQVTAALKALETAISETEGVYTTLRNRLETVLDPNASSGKPEGITPALIDVQLVDRLRTLVTRVTVLNSRIGIDLDALRL